MLEVNINQASLAITGGIFLGKLVFESHFGQGSELDLDKFDWRAPDRDLGVSHDAGCNEAHSFDRIFAWEIFDVFIDMLEPMNGECGCTDTLYFDAKFLQVKAKILHHIVRAGIADDCLAVV